MQKPNVPAYAVLLCSVLFLFAAVPVTFGQHIVLDSFYCEHARSIPLTLGVSDEPVCDPSPEEAGDLSVRFDDAVDRHDPPSLRSFFPDLKHSFKSVSGLASFNPGASRQIQGEASSFFDHAFQDALRFRRHEGLIDRSGDQLSGPLYLPGVMGGMLLSSELSGSGRFRSFSHDAAQGYLLNTMLSAGTRFSSPSTRLDDLERRAYYSGYTANAFTLATLTDYHYGHVAGAAAYAAASYVGWTRAQSDTQNLKDAIAGATVGYVLGRTLVRHQDARTGDRRIHWSLTPTPPGGGLGAGISISFKAF